MFTILTGDDGWAEVFALFGLLLLFLVAVAVFDRPARKD